MHALRLAAFPLVLLVVAWSLATRRLPLPAAVEALLAWLPWALAAVGAVLAIAFNRGVYYFHDVRISGFGPLFSGAFILSVVIFAIVLFRHPSSRMFVLIAGGAIIASLLVSEHTWWARYGPQLWWFPVLALVAVFAGADGRSLRVLAWVLVILLVVNVVPIAAVHFRWEADATRITNEQLQMLKGKTGIEADMQYFGEPFGERMKNAGVTFTPVEKLPCAQPVELMSVSPGYPCAVRVCFTSP